MIATEEQSEPLASGLRIILKRHFDDAVKLAQVLPGDQFCVLQHDDGTRGVVPVASVVLLGVGS